MTRVPLGDIARRLPSLAKSNLAAMAVAARRLPTDSIRNAHSTGITKLLSKLFHHSLADPSYATAVKLHLVNGGIENRDKRLLERVAGGSRRARTWIVPKSATIGDDVVIKVGDYWLFATGRINSDTKPSADWKNRYGAGLEAIELIDPQSRWLLSDVTSQT